MRFRLGAPCLFETPIPRGSAGGFRGSRGGREPASGYGTTLRGGSPFPDFLKCSSLNRVGHFCVDGFRRACTYVRTTSWDAYQD